MAKIIKALGHPLRLRIVLLVNDKGSMSVKQIHEELRVSQPEASKQLAVLRNNRVLSCQRKNGHAFYTTNPHLSFIDAIKQQIQRK